MADAQQPSLPTSSETPAVAAKPTITLQSILDCKEGSSAAMGKILTGASNNDQLQRMDAFQTSCLDSFTSLRQKLAQEVKSPSNLKLEVALENTQKRIILEQKMIKFLIKSDTPGGGIKMGEEILGFIFAAKMVAPQESEAWMEYKQSLEAEKSAPPKGSTDYLGWSLLIIMLIIVGRALLKKQGSKGTGEKESNEKGPL